MMRKILIGLAALVAVGVIGWHVIGGRLGVTLLIASFMKPSTGPTQEVSWREGPEAPRAATDKRPNIIVIVADDLGRNDISFFGGGVHPSVPTPHIDRIGREGVNFATGYAGNATCAPSRAALMTGRYATRIGYEFTPAPIGLARTIGHFDGDGPYPPIYHAEREAEMPPMEQIGLPAAEITIASLLRQDGYRTLHLGKWHLGDGPSFNPAAHGFDDSLGFMPGASLFLEEDDPDVVNAKQAFDPIDQFLWAALPFQVRFNGGAAFKPSRYMTDYLTDEAIKAIHANRNGPFFMYLAYNAPHTPLQATREDYDALADIPDHTRRVYAAMIRSLDRNIGRVMEALKAEGLDENTLVIFTSDNGGAHYVGLDGLNAPFRGWKATFFEGGLRAPFFMRWPAALPAGASYDYPVSHFDVFSTAAGAAGVAIPADRKIDGVNLLPYVAGATQGRPHETLFWRSGPYKAVRVGDWKLQVTETPRQDWLYDLTADPHETTNLAASRPDKLAELRAALEAENAEQVKPMWPALIEGPIPVDKPLNRPSDASDAYVYWSN